MADIDACESSTGAEGRGRRVILARVAGFCFGVRRALEMTEAARSTQLGRIQVLGSLVHNNQVIDRLAASGVGRASRLEDIQEGTVVISAHGIAPGTRRKALERGLGLLDATCPFVTKVHRSARQLMEAGYQVLLVGDAGHTEVQGVMGSLQEAGGDIRLVSSPEEVAGIPLAHRVGVVSQTTQRTDTFARVVGEVCRRCADVRAINTVCNATEELQQAAVDLSRECDVVIVVGGGSSANTRRLRELCEEAGTPAHQIETAADIDPAWLDGARTIGLTAGASTPDWLIEDVAACLNGGSLPEEWSVRHPDT